jgi:hypothetical protein
LFNGAGAEAAACRCALISGGAPQNVYELGVTSGIKGAWAAEGAGTLVHDRAAAAATPPPPPPPPPPVKKHTCADAPVEHGTDIGGDLVRQPSPSGGGSVGALRVPAGQAGYDACRESCCGNPQCKAWVVAAPDAPKGAAPGPGCVAGAPCCWHKGGASAFTVPCAWCTASVWDPHHGGGGGGGAALNEQVGNFALHVPTAGGATAAMLTADTLPAIWSRFAGGGGAAAAGAVSSAAVHGAVSSTVRVPAGGTATATVVFAWHFATRYFSAKPIGNFYAAHLHPSAAAAAAGLGATLPEVVATVEGWHAAFFDPDPGFNTVPVWLQDVLVNSMSQWRSGFMTADGRWRQWEAYDCVDVDSVHNDYQRSMPYALFFPDLVKNTMTTGWAKHQQPDGMITESLSGGCMGATGTLDAAAGRVMGDVSTVFLIEVLQLYEWTNDEAFLRELAPVALRAADWFANVGTAGTPLPHKQCCTYDIIQFADYDHTSYNSFLYLAALAAGERLGLHLHNASFSAA